MAENYIKRAWKSKGGAVVMFFVFTGALVVASILKLDYYSMNKILATIILPGTLIVSPKSGGPWLGVDTVTIALSLMIHMLIGYAFDWFYKPNK